MKAVVIVVVTALFATLVLGLERMPPRTVSVLGSLSDLQQANVERLLAAPEANTLYRAKSVLESSPWIARAEIKRRWPAQWEVVATAQTPVAMWNDEKLLNNAGIAFSAQYFEPAALPRLYGPMGSEVVVMRQFRQLNKLLLGANQSISTLATDDRGSWQFTAGQGMTVLLGQDDVLERLKRLIELMGEQSLSSRADEIAQIDTRYANGIAVSFKPALETDLAINAIAGASATNLHKKTKRDTTL
jgi:cell division protein FtsQ